MDAAERSGPPGAWEGIPAPDAELRLWRGFYREPHSGMLLRSLLDDTPWRQESIRLWGKARLQPRLTAWYGDAGSRYAYSGLLLEPQPWSGTLLAIRSDVERATGHRFNSVLLNCYRNEQDSIGWHSDAEAALGEQPVIASLSLGDTRIFRLRHKGGRHETLSLALEDGCLLLMAGSTQRWWQHAVMKERAPCGPRVNLTFRTIT